MYCPRKTEATARAYTGRQYTKSFVPYSGEVGVSGSSITPYIHFLVVLTKDLWKQGFILFVLWFEGHHSGEASCWGSVGIRP